MRLKVGDAGYVSSEPLFSSEISRIWGYEPHSPVATEPHFPKPKREPEPHFPEPEPHFPEPEPHFPEPEQEPHFLPKHELEPAFSDSQQKSDIFTNNSPGFHNLTGRKHMVTAILSSILLQADDIKEGGEGMPHGERWGSIGDHRKRKRIKVDKNGKKKEEELAADGCEYAPTLLWLSQISGTIENNCTVEIGKGFLNASYSHELLIQRHGHMMNCACGHNVDVLLRAKEGLDFMKDVHYPFICSPSQIISHRHSLRVVTAIPQLSLDDLLHSRHNLTDGEEEHARFLCACLVEAVMFLHNSNIIHRDITAENVYLDDRGWVKLANFHHAVQSLPGQYIQGQCGTLGYQAPEVVAGLGHMHTVDYWGIGCVVYHFAFGFSPFADEDVGRLKSKTVLNPEFAITRLGNRFRHLSTHGQEAIKGLLCKYPHKRVGYRFQEANKLKWFQPYRWCNLSQQCMESPLLIFLDNAAEKSSQLPDPHMDDGAPSHKYTDDTPEKLRPIPATRDPVGTPVGPSMSWPQQALSPPAYQQIHEEGSYNYSLYKKIFGKAPVVQNPVGGHGQGDYMLERGDFNTEIEELYGQQEMDVQQDLNVQPEFQVSLEEQNEAKYKSQDSTGKETGFLFYNGKPGNREFQLREKLRAVKDRKDLLNIAHQAHKAIIEKTAKNIENLATQVSEMKIGHNHEEAVDNCNNNNNADVVQCPAVPQPAHPLMYYYNMPLMTPLAHTHNDMLNLQKAPPVHPDILLGTHKHDMVIAPDWMIPPQQFQHMVAAGYAISPAVHNGHLPVAANEDIIMNSPAQMHPAQYLANTNDGREPIEAVRRMLIEKLQRPPPPLPPTRWYQHMPPEYGVENKMA